MANKLKDRYLIGLIAVFVLSRVMAFYSGVRIDLLEAYQWQLIDPALLKTRLFESLLNLHSQPPLFNAIHGAIIKISASSGQQVLIWMVLNFLVGLAMLGCIYGALCELKVPRQFAALLAGLFVCSPAAIVYENLLSYTYLDTALISAAMYLLVRFVSRPKPGPMWMFAAVLVALCWMRSAYHLIWLLAVFAVLLFFFRKDRMQLKLLLPASLVAVALVGGLYLKNYAMFGVTGPSSWVGMNLATMTHTNLPEEARQQLVGSQAASVLTEGAPFQALNDYPESFRTTAVAGIPILDMETRFDGSPNYNHRDYLPISSQFGRDAAVVIKTFPEVYLGSVYRNLANFVFRSSTDYRLVTTNVAHIQGWDALYSTLVYGRIAAANQLWGNSAPAAAAAPSLKHMSLSEVIALKGREACLLVAIIVVVLPCIAFIRMVRSQVVQDRVIPGFFLVTFGYVFLTTNLVNFGEAHRMRFEIEPLMVVMLGWLGNDLWRHWRSRRTV